MNWSKSLHPHDYKLLGDTTLMIDTLVADNVPHMAMHLHRRWEYGMCIRYLQERGAETVVDVGGAGSLFAPLAAVYGFHVTVVDPLPTVKLAEIQGHYLGMEIKSICGTDIPHADAVVALSTIEHVDDDAAFLASLQDAGKIVFLTTDYSEDGKVYTADQKRTYTRHDLSLLADGDYEHYAPYINGMYSFASVAA